MFMSQVRHRHCVKVYVESCDGFTLQQLIVELGSVTALTNVQNQF